MKQWGLFGKAIGTLVQHEKKGNIGKLGRSLSVEESVCLAKEVQTCARCSKNILTLVARIDHFLSDTYFLVLMFKEAGLPWTEYLQ